MTQGISGVRGWKNSHITPPLVMKLSKTHVYRVISADLSQNLHKLPVCLPVTSWSHLPLKTTHSGRSAEIPTFPPRITRRFGRNKQASMAAAASIAN